MYTNNEQRDVRNFETIDHKMLKQWEEKKASNMGKKELGKFWVH